MHYSKPILKFFFILCIGLPLASCSNEASLEEKYSKLCKIYEDVNSLDKDKEAKRQAIIDRVDTQLPDFFDEYFVDILRAEPSRRYDFTQQMVEVGTGNSDWECPAMKTYYDNY